MKCSNCSAKIKKGNTFCTNCGVSVNDNSYAGYKISSANKKVKPDNVVRWSWKDVKFSGLSHFCSVIICMLMIVVALSGMVSYTIGSAFSETGIKKTLSAVKITDLEIGELMDSNNPKAKLADVIYDDVIGPATATKYNIKKRDIKLFIESKEVQEFASEELNAYYRYVVEDEGKGIVAKDIVAFAKANSKTFEKELHFKPTETDYMGMQMWLDNALGEGGRFASIGKGARESFEGTELKKYLDIVGVLSSDEAKLFVAVIGIALLLLMILVDKNKVYIAFNYLWVVNLINAIVCAILYFGKGIIVSVLIKYVEIDKKMFVKLLDAMLNGMKVSMIVFGAMAVAFLLIAVIIKYTVPLFKRKVA